MWGSLANLAEQAGSLAKQAADSQLVRLRPPCASFLPRLTERELIELRNPHPSHSRRGYFCPLLST
jgi:hypothetical protein